MHNVWSAFKKVGRLMNLSFLVGAARNLKHGFIYKAHVKPDDTTRILRLLLHMVD